MAKRLPFDLADLATPADRLLRETAFSGLGSIGLTADSLSHTRGIIESQLFQEALVNQKMLAELAQPYGGIVEMFRQQDQLARHAREASKAYQQLNDGGIAHWAPALASTQMRELNKLYAHVPDLLSEASKIRELAQSAVGRDLLRIQNTMSQFTLPSEMAALLSDTSVKMSVLAGIQFTSGFDTKAFDQAYAGLLGHWRTTPDLPEIFWIDPEFRQRRYRDAEVDPGIIVASPSATIQVMVESGLAVGDTDQSGAVALFCFGTLSVSIRSSTAELDAHSAVAAFERSLRDFISYKLEAIGGRSWFKQRAPGNIHTKARERRAAALAVGEQSTRLIDYTDFGELKEIILRGDNWEQAFEPIFVNRDRFEQDMQTLLTVRRPSSHSRIVGSTHLLEALLVMKRLDAQMTDNGAWLAIADSNE